jgi:hypothetical protein
MKAEKTPKTPNPCLSATITKQEYPCDHFAVHLPFTPSNKALQKYCAAKGQKPVLNYRASPPAITFNNDAVEQLKRRYPKDELYPLLEKYREYEKAGGTYINGTKPAADGRVHEEFKHTPKTLRLAMEILQLLPRPEQDEEDSIYARVRGLFIAAPGHCLLSRDFGGIEGVITAYLANDRNLYRLTKLGGGGVHTFITCHATGHPADLAWSDEDLVAHFLDMRSRKEKFTLPSGQVLPFDVARDSAKTAFYAFLYAAGAEEMARRRPKFLPTPKIAQWYKDFIYDLFPSIPQWQTKMCLEAEKQGYLLAPSGFRMWFPDGVFDYKWVEESINPTTGLMDPAHWDKRMGEIAKQVIAAKPQHTAFGFSARAMKKAYDDPFMREHLRLSIHDEILNEVPMEKADEFDDRLGAIMEMPDVRMPLPPEWGLGDFVSIGTDGKRSGEGGSWAGMKKVKR